MRSGIVALVLALAGCRGSTTPPDSEFSIPALIAHRGASAVAPENTIVAFDAALSAGADYIEFDVRMTRDGVLVVFHDDLLDRTASGAQGFCTGHVHERLWSEIATCEVGTWFNRDHPAASKPGFVGARIPTLAEVFARYAAKAGFYLEIKDAALYPEIVAKVLAEIEKSRLAGAKFGGRDALYIQSFDALILQQIRARAPSLRLIYLQGSGTPEGSLALFTSVRSYAAGIAPAASLATASYVSDAHRVCLVVHPWVVNSVEQYAQLSARGVDGVLTDNPALIRPLMIERTRPPTPDRCANN